MTTNPQDLERARDWYYGTFGRDDENAPAVSSLAALLAAEREPLERRVAELEAWVRVGQYAAERLRALLEAK